MPFVSILLLFKPQTVGASRSFFILRLVWVKGDSAWTQIEDFWNFWKLLSSFFSVIFWCNTEEQTQLQCLKCPVGNVRCLRFLWWALMLCSYISISLHLLWRENEGKKRSTEVYSLSSIFSLMAGCGGWRVLLKCGFLPVLGPAEGP